MEITGSFEVYYEDTSLYKWVQMNKTVQYYEFLGLGPMFKTNGQRVKFRFMNKRLNIFKKRATKWNFETSKNTKNR